MTRSDPKHDDEHPAQAMHGCEADKRCRDFGYRIIQRPPGHESIWNKNGEVYSQSEALRDIDAAIKAAERGT